MGMSPMCEQFVWLLYIFLNQNQIDLMNCDVLYLKTNPESSVLYVKKTMLAYVGGLLSCYSLTGEGLFREKAIQIAQDLLAAYNKSSGLPYSWFNTKIGVSSYILRIRIHVRNHIKTKWKIQLHVDQGIGYRYIKYNSV